MKIEDFDYFLPQGLIAQEPAKVRDQSNLLVLERKTAKIRHLKFAEIVNLLSPSDILVFNNTKVIPARLKGKKSTGGKQEILLIHPLDDQLTFKNWPSKWLAIAKPFPKLNQKIYFPSLTNRSGLEGKIIQISKDNLVIEFNQKGKRLEKTIYKFGEAPLPPYIKNPTSRSFKQYQTVYAKEQGSAAAPTAGFHFSKRLLARIKRKGIEMEYLTLHVGLGTFAPVREKNIEKHQIHPEYFEISAKTAKNLNEAKKKNKKIIAVGTTVARSLEFGSDKKGVLQPQNGWNNLFVIPGYKFKFVDKLITNFHLPKSTLLMLVSAFAGQKLISESYQEAIKKKYRFYSFGDAMFII